MRICSGERLHFRGLLFLIGQDGQSLFEAERRAAMPPSSSNCPENSAGSPGCQSLSSHCNIKVSMGQTLALLPGANSTGIRDQQSAGVSRMGTELPGAAALARKDHQ